MAKFAPKGVIMGPMSGELAGIHTGAPTQARQGTSKKNSEKEGKTNLLLSVAVRLLVKYEYYSTLSGFAAPSALLAPSSPLAGSSTTHGAMAHGGSPPPETIVIYSRRGAYLHHATAVGAQAHVVGLAEGAAGAALAHPLAYLTVVPSSVLVAATSSNTYFTPKRSKMPKI
jgi:hypothetical protein